VITSTDGREFVWCVFDSDGYECSDFVAVFGSEKEAYEFAVELRIKAAREWKKLWKGDEFHGEDRRTIDVRRYALGAPA
jgi:hypothetical protein